MHTVVGNAHQQDGSLIQENSDLLDEHSTRTAKIDLITRSLCRAVDANGLIDDN